MRWQLSTHSRTRTCQVPPPLCGGTHPGHETPHRPPHTWGPWISSLPYGESRLMLMVFVHRLDCSEALCVCKWMQDKQTNYTFASMIAPGTVNLPGGVHHLQACGG